MTHCACRCDVDAGEVAYHNLHVAAPSRAMAESAGLDIAPEFMTPMLSKTPTGSQRSMVMRPSVAAIVEEDENSDGDGPPRWVEGY
jgi:hypothetical protein